MSTTSRIVATRALTAAQRAECHRHFSRYMAISAEEYGHSLDHKTWIALHRDTASGHLIGQVSARIARERHPVDGRPLVILSSHHAAIDPTHRRDGLVQRSIFWFCLKARARHPLAQMLFLFDAMGYGSYLHLAHGLAECWPRHDAAMPEEHRVLLHHLMQRDHAEAWLPERGVLRWPNRRLQAGAAAITDEMQRSDPHIRFFAQANPGHETGESLVCLAPVSWGNFSHAVWHRMIRRQRRQATRKAG
jgi:hypothetical protein